jgi:hypothetical protein
VRFRALKITENVRKWREVEEEEEEEEEKSEKRQLI